MEFIGTTVTDHTYNEILEYECPDCLSVAERVRKLIIIGLKEINNT